MTHESRAVQGPVIVLGMHRTGTSAICALVHSCGYSFGSNLIAAAPDNPKGFWEDRRLVEINNRLLGGETAWSKISPPTIVATSEPDDAWIWYRELSEQARGPVAFKDPRMCRLMPFWSRIVNCPRVLMARRSPAAVAASLQRRNGFDPTLGWLLWVVHNFEAIRSIVTLGIESMVVDYDRLVQFPDAMAGEIRKFLEVDHADLSAVDASLRHKFSSRSSDEIPGFVASFADDIYRLLGSGDLESIVGLEDAYQALLQSYRFVDVIVSGNADERTTLVAYQQHMESDLAALKVEAETFAQERAEGAAYQAHMERDLSALKRAVAAHEEKWAAGVVYRRHMERDLSELKTDIEAQQRRHTRDIGKLNSVIDFERSRLRDLEATNAAILEAKIRAEEEQVKILKEVSVLAATRSRLEADRASRDEAIARLTADQIALEGEISALTGENARLEDARAAMEKTRWEVDALLLAVYDSPYWKLTKPLRTTVNWLKDAEQNPFARLLLRASVARRELSQRLSVIGISGQNAAAMDALVATRWLVGATPQVLRPSLEDVAWPEITVSIVTYNNGRWLDRFLRSLLDQNYPLDKIHLAFVDNSSTDATFENLMDAVTRCRGRFAGTSVEARPNKGFGAGHDLNIRAASTQFVLVTNIDLEFLPDSIPRVVAVALHDREAASWELRQLPYEHPKYVDPVSLCVNWSSHACILLSRECYLAVGGYEKRIFMYGEDVELSYRFRRAGYLLRYVPSAAVGHYTYTEAHEIKALQFSGSLLANFLIRLRYGTLVDALGGAVILTRLFARGAGFEGSRRLILGILPRVLLFAPAFVLTRKKSPALFPFRDFDYELARDGAFHEVPALPDDRDELPLVSVVTRTYTGRGELLRQAMISVINQTYPNVEHIIVEDGGDSAARLVEELPQLPDPAGYSVRHVACDKKGRSHAGNRGMSAATGKYLVLLDDDDLLFPDHIEVLYHALVAADTDAAYGLAWEVETQFMDKELRRYRELNYETKPLFFQPFDRDVLKHHNFLPIQSVLFDKVLFDACGGFDEDLAYLEDWVLWKKYGHNGDFVYVPKTTSLFRTPADCEEVQRRKDLLDAAYQGARDRAIPDCGNQSA